MVYRKSQRKQSLIKCIVAITVFIIGITAGVSFAYFSDSAKAENILNFGKLKIKTGSNEKVEVTLTENATTSGKLAPNDTVTISGEIGLEEGSVNAYIRMKIIVYEKGKEVEIDSTFNDAFMAEMAKIQSGNMKWFVAEDGYMYLGNEIVAGEPFKYKSDNTDKVTLTNEMIPEVLQGVGVDVVFVYQAIQSSGLNGNVKENGYTENNANSISKLEAWTEYNKQDFELGTWTAPTHTANAMDGYGTFNKGAMVEGKYTHIQFGKYPQTRYTGDTTALKNTGRKYVLYKIGVSSKVRLEYDIYRSTSTNKEYIKMDSANAYNNNFKYSDGEIVIIGSTNLWFELEPIVWQILGGYNGEGRSNLLLSSVKALTSMSFGDSDLYKESEIKSYLENEFYTNAFTYAEKHKINKYVNVATAETGTGTSDVTTVDEEKTNSTVFLLGYGDMIKSEYGFNNNATTKDNAKVRYPTDYAGANYTFLGSDEGVGNNWHLRSKGPDNATDKYNYFIQDSAVGYWRTKNIRGIVPALYLNI